MVHEHLESLEVHEHMSQALERAEHAKHPMPPWTKQLSLTTAIVAVFTAISSLGAGHLATHAIIYKNDTVYLQAKASDQWAYYQAKGLKALIYTSQYEILKALKKPAEAQAAQKQIERYRQEQVGLKTEGDDLERQLKETNEKAERCLRYHHHFAFAVTLFQVTIALSAIAVLTWRKSLWWLGLGISLIAMVYAIQGLCFFI